MSNFDLRTRMREKLESAWQELASGEEVLPSWYLYAPRQADYGNAFLLVTPWTNDGAKIVAVELIATFVREANPHPIAFIFVSDAWSRTIAEGEILDRPVSEYLDAHEVLQVVGYTATEGLMLHRPYRHRDDGTLEVIGPDEEVGEEVCGGMTDLVVEALRGVPCS